MVYILWYVDIEKFLHESALELQEVFNQFRGFDTTQYTLRRFVGEAIKSIGRLETDAMILCKIVKQLEGTRKTYLSPP